MGFNGDIFVQKVLKGTIFLGLISETNLQSQRNFK